MKSKRENLRHNLNATKMSLVIA